MEMLVAVALSAVIMVALFGMFSAVVEVVSGVKSHEDAANGERVFEGVLFDDLRSIYADSGNDFIFVGKGGAFLGLDGEFLSFCTSVSLGKSLSTSMMSLQRVKYVLRRSGESSTVFRKERSYCGIQGDWEFIEFPVLTGVRDLEIQYLDPSDNTYVTEWSHGNGKFPKVVVMNIVYMDGHEHSFAVELSTMAGEFE